jgi:hypothetical protein
MSTWDEPDFSPPFAPSTERLVPRIPSLAEQRAQIAERCRIRDLWPQTIIHGRNPSRRRRHWRSGRKEGATQARNPPRCSGARNHSTCPTPRI